MKVKVWIKAVSVLGTMLFSVLSFAQTEPDSIAIAKNEFEEHFFEALKQKGIENYDKAIVEIEKCLVKEPNNPVLHHELGKNYLALKKYPEAQRAFQKAVDLNPKERWYWNGLYDVYYETKDYPNSIIVVQKLIEFDKEFQDDLVSLYMYTHQFEKALALIEEMERTSNISQMMETYKLQILSESQHNKPQKEQLEQAIVKYPKVEENYIQLIYLYTESNQEEKALEVAKKLEQNIPNSDWAQVSLFKFHLNNGDGAKAASAMQSVLNSTKIEQKIKHRILNEFLIFVNKTNTMDNELEKAVDVFEDQTEVNVAKEIGVFFLNKKKNDKAVHYFEKSLLKQKDDILVIELLLQCYTDTNQFDKVYKRAEDYLEMYPSQARLYFYAGLAQNQLKNYKKAVSILNSGIDFVVDDIDLEINFNIQLGEAYNGLGDQNKKYAYFNRAEQLLKQKK
ncbi:TPR domain protein [Flavobacterium enshiense DK69]|uniref:Cytochrome C biosynthesis protein n=1 Tax=Flavobacterium enshiense DK69 TaxID=1107311 RepID=V6SC91_9FLAO|nr:tetratricopeptide repeat protein [Flavobacterium enshiense]ESU24216.1 TPR domain protein [Flavobacterium enshiense DK69]KGO95408.1 cytochrome C biosynthesis protein [Flavobacterium enshiense DK69]